MEEKFQDVLEKGEKIIKIYKPDKVKYWLAFILSAIFCWIWVFFILVGSIPEEGASFDPNLFQLLLIISFAVFVGGLLVSILFGAIYYRNRFYAYTDKRIIIRSGIIGIDFKSLEFKTLTATIVSVNVLDKILRRNTGSILFASPASPVVGGGGTASPYAFKHILKPYDTLREIKERIDKVK